MEYSGIYSIIGKGEEIKSKQHTYTIKEVINIGMTNTYLALNEHNKEVIVKQFRNKDKRFINTQKRIFHFIKNLHFKDRDFSKYIEFIFEQFIFKDYLFEIKKKVFATPLDEAIFKLSSKERIDIAREVTKIVAILHKHGLIHTDLKLEQFLVAKNNRVKLIDFNNVIIPKEKIFLPASTPGWRSPEHIEKKKITYKSDIFTLGIMIYAIITKRHPFFNSLQNASYDKDIFNIKPLEISELIPIFPKYTSKVINSCFNVNPKFRPNIWVLYNALNSLYSYFLFFKTPLYIYTSPFKVTKIKGFEGKFPSFKVEKIDNEYVITALEKGLRLNNKTFKREKLKNNDIINLNKKYFLKFKRSLI